VSHASSISEGCGPKTVKPSYENGKEKARILALAESAVTQSERSRILELRNGGRMEEPEVRASAGFARLRQAREDPS